MTQQMKRRQRRAAKANDRASDVVSVRGYSTDQRISIESMNVNIRRLEHQKMESKLVGLSIQEAAIRGQILGAENRAALRCPEYDPTNLYWQRVDLLVQQQTECVVMMNRYNNDMLIENDGNGVVPKAANPQVSAFLNQPSPVKTNMKRSFTDLVGDGNQQLAFDINDEDNFDNDNVGCIGRSIESEEEMDYIQSKDVKKEKIKKAKNQSSKGPTRVSKRKKKPKRR